MQFRLNVERTYFSYPIRIYFAVLYTHMNGYIFAGFSVLGDLLSVVRIKRDMRPPLNETDLMARLNTVDEQSALSALMVHTLDRFIGSHILRVTLPSGITAALKGNARSIAGNTIDINLSRAIGEGTW